MGRPQPVEAAERCGDADRAAGVAAEREVAGARRRGRGRPARRTAGNAPRRAQVGRRSVMGIHAGDAEEQFIADGLADDGGAGSENLRDRCRIGARRSMGGKPGRVAGSGPRARDVVHVLDGSGQARERPGAAARDRRSEIMGNEKRAAPVLVLHRVHPPVAEGVGGLHSFRSV